MKDAERLNVRDVSEGAVIAVKVVPGSSRDKVVGVLGDCLKITTAVAAEKGRANAAVLRTLARALGTDRKAVSLRSGQTHPRKEFLVVGMSAVEVRGVLASL
jgi:uncharacterized protein